MRRIQKYFKRLGKKGASNSGAFVNTTLWLEAVVGGKNISATNSNFILTLGGNVSNPKCTTDTGGESMKTLFDRLSLVGYHVFQTMFI